MNYTRLKKIRLSHVLTQKEVAEKLGMSQPNYQRWESGAAPIPKRQLKRLAKVLRTTTEELLGKARPFDFLGIEPGADPERQRAESIEWQLMCGELRKAHVDSDEALAEAFDVFGLGDPDVDIAEDSDFFLVNVEGYHRSILLNTASIEWISVPTHRLRQGALSEAEDLVDGTAADETSP